MTIHTQLIGRPRTLSDAKGEWVSAIGRQVVTEPITLELRGLVGDQVADTKHHGSLDQAVCCHPLAHYTYWSDRYGVELAPGTVGENWTIVGGDESDVCIGDIYQVGTARVLVSAPRFPCSKQERKVGIKGFLKAVFETQKTGWYLRVLTPGTVQVGDTLTLEARPHPEVTLAAANQGLLGPEVDLVLIEQLLAVPELAAMWKRGLRRRLGEDDT